MNKRHHRTFQSVALACISSCLISFHAQAAEVPIPQCPAKIVVKQEVNSPIENDWKVANDNRGYSLKYIGFSDLEYPTIQTGLLIPSEEKKQKGTRKFFYDYLSPPPNEPHDSWVVCAYRDTSIVLVRKLPETVARCEVDYPYDTRHAITFRCFDTPHPDAK
jgi:hypothetical protein